ncbi:DNA repair protein RecO [Methylotenera sp. L2L1]|uniref:DNA repair protein RecO n=1 Tax=Methylotenera sp. L2L1 TaxID=1502770 RepID=UPI00056793FE|nr:DNA repair protein RecO [Methylotenera sp. L2L1]
MASVSTHRQDNQAVYVLHTYPFKETSLVVELFARDFGRVATTAKGARRPRSAMRGMLQAFQPMLATWSGKLELKTLHSLEWNGVLPLLQGEALMCGFYLNELLLRLLPREDPHETLFEYYADTLKSLAISQDLATTLRRFELKFLQELGYAIPLHLDANSMPILTEQHYRYEAEHGAYPIRGTLSRHETGVPLSGKTLIDMSNDDYRDEQTQQQSKQLMRYLLAHYLGDKPLHTRQLLIDLQGY